MTPARAGCWGAAATVLAAACTAQSPAPQPIDAAAQFRATCGASRPASTPPPRPESASAPGNANARTMWFVLDRVYLGTNDLRTKMPTNDAWKCYGFDLDGRATAATGESTCARRPGASRAALKDGAGGIDNSFGKNVLPLLRSVDPCIADAKVGTGGLSLYLRVDDAGAGDTDHAPGAIYVASQARGAPSSSARIDVPVAKFDGGYVSGGVWVSGAPATEFVNLPLQIGFDFELEGHKTDACPRTAELRIPLGAVVLTAHLEDGGDGMIAGVIAEDALEDAMRRWLGDFGVCGKSGASIASTLGTESSDLVLGADRFQDPSRTCDAVSFGAGLRLKSSADPASYAIFPERRDPCAKP